MAQFLFFLSLVLSDAGVGVTGAEKSVSAHPIEEAFLALLAAVACAEFILEAEGVSEDTIEVGATSIALLTLCAFFEFLRDANKASNSKSLSSYGRFIFSLADRGEVASLFLAVSYAG